MVDAVVDRAAGAGPAPGNARRNARKSGANRRRGGRESGAAVARGDEPATGSWASRIPPWVLTSIVAVRAIA